MDATCATCSCEEEDISHLLLNCHFSRLCWLISPLAIRSHCLIGDLKQILLHFMDTLSDEQWNCFDSISWTIWRCRNEMIYDAKVPTVLRFFQFLKEISAETALAATQSNKPHQTTSSNGPVTLCQYSCYIDGSWKSGWSGGIGFVIFNNSELLLYHSAKAKACCPIQAEAIALKEAVSCVTQRGFYPCNFYTDNLTIAEACNQQQPPKEMDWRAFHESLQLWESFKGSKNLYCNHKSRDENEFADFLAKKGRSEDWMVTGFTFPVFKP